MFPVDAHGAGGLRVVGQAQVADHRPAFLRQSRNVQNRCRPSFQMGSHGDNGPHRDDPCSAYADHQYVGAWRNVKRGRRGLCQQGLDPFFRFLRHAGSPY